jgi:hypothetical protein
MVPNANSAIVSHTHNGDGSLVIVMCPPFRPQRPAQQRRTDFPVTGMQSNSGASGLGIMELAAR